MTGTVINAWAILAGTVLGLTSTKELSPANQLRLKTGMGVFTVYIGLSTTWSGLNGTVGQLVTQLGMVALALVLGNIAGKLMRLQKASNRLGQYARDQLAHVSQTQTASVGDGFLTCSVLFCVGPIALLGAAQDGIAGDYKLLAIKSLMDGLAAAAFAKTFGWSVLLSAVPVLAYQGSVSLAARAVQPFLVDHALLDAFGVTSGLLICCVAMVILDLKKVRLADYLPSLLFAPVFTHLFG